MAIPNFLLHIPSRNGFQKKKKIHLWKYRKAHQQFCYFKALKFRQAVESCSKNLLGIQYL